MAEASKLQMTLARFGLDRVDEYRARQASIEAIPDALQRLLAAAEWHIESNGEAVVGRDGRQLQTMGMISASQAVVSAIQFAKPLDERIGGDNQRLNGMSNADLQRAAERRAV